MIDAQENPFAHLDDLPAHDLARRFADVQDKLAEIDERRKEVQREYDYIRKRALPNAMERDGGMNSLNLDGVGRISLRSDLYVTMPANRRDDAMNWLRGTGHGGVIKESVHAGTLKALMKELLRSGKPLPPEEFVRIQPYDMAVLTRSKK